MFPLRFEMTKLRLVTLIGRVASGVGVKQVPPLRYRSGRDDNSFFYGQSLLVEKPQVPPTSVGMTIDL
jgi:hypothetical protein